MKKELKQILLICLFLIIGCVLGYFVALNQMNQLSDPEYIAFWTSQNMSVPEPLGFTRSILSFGLLFAGIPTGLIFYSGLVKKWLTPIAPKIIIGFVTFPIYTLAGVIGSIPFIIYQNGKDTAHYCDRAGFSEVPEFLQPAQKSREITERIQTPRGSFYLCGMTKEQMEADGYGFHHASEDGKYLIMANGTQAYAVRADAPEKDNPLRTAEMTLEDDYGMIDGVINNGRRGEELEKAREHAERTQPEKKPSIRERLAAAKQECAKQQPRPAPEKKPPELGER